MQVANYPFSPYTYNTISFWKYHIQNILQIIWIILYFQHSKWLENLILIGEKTIYDCKTKLLIWLLVIKKDTSEKKPYTSFHYVRICIYQTFSNRLLADLHFLFPNQWSLCYLYILYFHLAALNCSCCFK